LIGALPYLLGNVDRGYLTQRGPLRAFAHQVMHLPSRLALDFVELVVIARAAIRERVPLL
jgi:hypothetical protein